VLAVGASQSFVKCDYQLTPYLVSLLPQDEVHQVRFAGANRSRLESRCRFRSWEIEATYLSGEICGRAIRTRFCQEAGKWRESGTAV